MLTFMERIRKPQPVAPMEFPPWNSADAIGSLASFYDVTVRTADSYIDWYRKHVVAKRLASRSLRLIAIVFVAIGTLAPLVQAVWSNTGLAIQGNPSNGTTHFEWGYLAFGLAAACVGADKFFGVSTGWIRYIKTQMSLEMALSEFRYDWVLLVAKFERCESAPDQIPPLLQRLKDFIVQVHLQVQQETEAWILEFQSNLADLERTIKSQTEARKPGKIQVTVSNARDCGSELTAFLNRAEMKPIQGSTCLFTLVPAGEHEVLIKGSRNGKTLEASGFVKVSPDAMAPITIEMPMA
jgi:hypothetical protein